MIKMSKVADFQTHRLKALAKKFVEVYVADGESAAGEWATQELYEHQYEDFRPHVHDAFREAGYEVTLWEEVD